MTDTEQKHTPGPWSITNSGEDGHHYKVQIGTHDRTVAYAWSPAKSGRQHEADANAELIASAPDLKAKVEELTPENERLRIGIDGGHFDYAKIAERQITEFGEKVLELQSQIATMKDREDWTLKNIDRALDELADGKFQCVNYTLSNLVKLLNQREADNG